MNLFFAAWIACQAADATTTAIALKHPRVSEANPIMRPAGLTIRVSVNVGAFFVAKKGTERQQKVIASAFAASGCGAAAWNVSQLRSLRGDR